MRRRPAARWSVGRCHSAGSSYVLAELTPSHLYFPSGRPQELRGQGRGSSQGRRGSHQGVARPSLLWKDAAPLAGRVPCFCWRATGQRSCPPMPFFDPLPTPPFLLRQERERVVPEQARVEDAITEARREVARIKRRVDEILDRSFAAFSKSVGGQAAPLVPTAVAWAAHCSAKSSCRDILCSCCTPSRCLPPP